MHISHFLLLTGHLNYGVFRFIGSVLDLGLEFEQVSADTLYLSRRSPFFVRNLSLHTSSFYYKKKLQIDSLLALHALLNTITIISVDVEKYGFDLRLRKLKISKSNF